MPYICLATSLIPNGKLQITDLHPNTSQRNQSIDPPGQTKYVNRVQNDVVRFSTSTGKTLGVEDLKGLGAYLACRVKPANGATTSTVTVASANVSDTVTIAGVVFTAQAGGANAELLQWNQNGSDASDASSLVAAINSVAGQAAIKAAVGNDIVLTASNGGIPTAVVALAFYAVGDDVDFDAFTLATNNNTRLAKSASKVIPIKVLGTSTRYKAAADAIIARLDAGNSITLANVNSVLTTHFGGTTTLSTSSSVGTLADVLDILSGRGFSVPGGTALFTTPTSDPTWVGGTNKGSFTSTVTTYGEEFERGEWRPSTLGGDALSVENKPIRSTVDSDAFQQSMLNGQLSKFASTITLFPDSDALPFIPTAYQPESRHKSETTLTRLITVYDEDGNVLL
jgi:hypothetical protein